MPVADSAAAAIKNLILTGELQAGDRLPAERALAAQLGVSRNSLREAVAALTEMGVLEARHGDGTYLTTLDPRALFESMGFAVDLMRTAHLPDVLAVRRTLEAFATGLAASVISDEEIHELDALQQGVFAAGLAVEDQIRLDIAFHARISTIAGNGVLAGLLDVIRGTAIQASQWRGANDPSGIDRADVEHRMIVDALRARDSGLAATLAASHVAGVEAWIHSRSGGARPLP